MRFDWNNQCELTDIDLGNSILVHYEFLYEKSRVSLRYYSFERKMHYSFVFFNVLFSSIHFQTDKTNTDYTISISAEENSKELKQLADMKYPSWLEWNPHFLTVIFKNALGHELQVICDTVYFLEWADKYHEEKLLWISDGYKNYTGEDIQEINKIYVHDSTFAGFCYSWENQKIVFGCANSHTKKWYGFEFSDIIFCSLENCCSWGESIRVLDIYAKEVIPDTVKNPNDPEHCFTVGLELASGDEMLIACKQMACKEESQGV